MTVDRETVIQNAYMYLQFTANCFICVCTIHPDLAFCYVLHDAKLGYGVLILIEIFVCV